MRKHLIILFFALSPLIIAKGQMLTDVGLMEIFQFTKPDYLQYWFDDDTDHLQISDGLSGSYTLDVSSLADGLHTLHYQVVGADGIAYGTASAIFLKTITRPASSASSIALANSRLQYWFDDDTGHLQISDGLSGSYTLDVSSLADGLHTLHYQVVGTDDISYDQASGLFLKMGRAFFTTTATPKATKMRYWFNSDASSTIVTDITRGSQMIDVLDLPFGLHTLHYQLMYDDASLSPVASALFLRQTEKSVSNGPNGIIKYQYWLNDNTVSVHTIPLDELTNPFRLISLLPLTHEPIRSSSFHFEVRDGSPIVFAKNDLRVRFHDARSYFVDGNGISYVDYAVQQLVSPDGEIQPTQTFNRLPNNEIKWYTVNVEAGDTVAFRLSQPATVQLFSPKGKEIFKTSGSASVKWEGIHTWEDGTYYLAVHDLTGTQSDMTLNYMHMDKYDVVDWDIHTVGNGGCSTITFKGNGFRDLCAVYLVTNEGDTIPSLHITHDSDAETSVTFNFKGAGIGDYGAIFHFTEEDRIMANIVSVEDAVDIQLAADVSFPSSFLSGASSTYTVKITNRGNMTAYNVPVYIQIITDDIRKISQIVLGGSFESQSLSKDLKNNIMDDLDRQVAMQTALQLGDMASFIVMHDSVNNKDYAFTYSFPTIQPNSTNQITISIQSTSPIDAGVYLPSTWYPLREDNARGGTYHMSIGEWLCCYRERIECIADIVSEVVDAIPGIPANINCSVQIGNTLAQAIFDIGCTEGASIGEKIHKYAEAQGRTFMTQMISQGLSCILGYYNNKLDDLEEQLKEAKVLGAIDEVEQLTKEMEEIRRIKSGIIVQLFGVGSKIASIVQTASNCYSAFTQPVIDCPQNRSGMRGISTPYVPRDPNDIYGYLSEAGCRFIVDSVAKVSYTIEFENDTAFATAAAHTIVVKDTLEAKHFDLKSFLPTGIRLGSRETFLDESDVTTKNGVTSFVKTIDMRPAINAIAQVEGAYDQSKGIAEWRFTSLDPMTMEPTDDIMQGILPVNYDGTSGIGEVMFEVGVKAGKADGAEIANRAGIVFDYEEAILTPTWVNTVDAVAPVSTIRGGIQAKADTLTLRLAGEDARSGVWKYEVYAQAGEGATWEKVAETLAAGKSAADGEATADDEAETLCDVHIYEGIEYGFLVLATDSAGNVERKSFEEADFRLSTVTPGDANGDGTVDALDVMLVTNYYLGGNVYLNLAAADVNADGEVNALDVVAIQNIYLNDTGRKSAIRKRDRKFKN